MLVQTWILWSVYSLLVANVGGQLGIKVQTKVGEIQGFQDDFVKFLGIPYAIVDISDPFGPANPNVRFEIPYSATKDPEPCPQIVNETVVGNIQCLHLNIYKPIAINNSNTLPVMVFIHGGGFEEGDGNFGTYSPIFLVEKDIIVVSINYRLGPYGFLCVEDGYKNQGLKDQELALKWVKDNIKEFGGDETNIALLGHSAGSMSVDYHLSSNKEKVFNKAILQSGVMLSPLVVIPPKQHSYLNETATKLGINTKSLKPKDILKELTKIDKETLIYLTRFDVFRPCVDDFKINSPKTNYLKDLKIMIGTTDSEMGFIYKHVTDYTNKIKDDLKAYIDNISEKYIEKVEKVYLKHNLEADSMEFGGDFIYYHPTERTIRHYLKNDGVVYKYLFTYDGGRNFVKIRDKIIDKGAVHGDELGYIFNMDLLYEEIKPEDRAVIDVMTTFWTNFVKYGNPNNKSNLNQWPQYREDTQYYINIGATPVLESSYHKQKIHFWDEFYQDVGIFYKGYHYEDEMMFVKSGESVV